MMYELSEDTTAAGPSRSSPRFSDVRTRTADIEAGHYLTEKDRKRQKPSRPALYRPWDQYQMGYPRFAAFIAEDKDKSTTIYRRFERLAARNLLYLESELAELEARQDELDEAYVREPFAFRMTANNWKAFRTQAPRTFYNLNGMDGLPEFLEEQAIDQEDEKPAHNPGASAVPVKSVSSNDPKTQNSKKDNTPEDNPSSRKRLLLAYRIRAVLKEYYEFLKLEIDILALAKPDRRSWKATRKIFKNYDPKSRTYQAEMIGGEMRTHLEGEHKHDLCVLAPPVERDRLTKLLEGRLAWIFRRRTSEGSTYYVPEQRVKLFVTFFSIIAAAAFLIGAIVGLYVVTNPTTQLFMLGGFTIGFAGALGLLTNARRQDVFAATAAYAAVLVVFISGSLSNQSSSSSSTIITLSADTITSTMIKTSAFTFIEFTTATFTAATQSLTDFQTATVSAAATVATSLVATTTASSNNMGSDSTALNTGDIVGIVIGSVAAVSALFTIYLTYIRWRRKYWA